MVLEKKEFRVYDLELLYNQELANQATEGMDAYQVAAAAGLIRGAKRKGRKGGRGEVKPGRDTVGQQRPLKRRGLVRPGRKLKK